MRLAVVPTAGVHNEFYYHLALSSDGQSLLATTEYAGATADRVKIWNISNLGAITLRGFYSSPGGAVPHQISVVG